VPQFTAPSSLDALTGYTHRKATSRRFFCSNCGCHIGDVGLNDPGWVISASIFDKGTNFSFESHMCTKSVKDGGLANWLPQVQGREMKTWNPDEDGDAVLECKAEVGSGGEERLRAECHCGGVSFTISRPTPYVLEHKRFKEYVSRVDETKWMACADLCDDCRLVAGTHVSTWTFVPRSLITPSVDEDLLLGTSKTFSSSEGVLRSFCGTCGATVFYACDDRKDNGDQVVDVSVGILRAPEGTLAQNWLTWRAGRVGWFDDGLKYDEDFALALAKGMADWGRCTYGKDLDFAIGSP
jgi:hypothetical protein